MATNYINRENLKRRQLIEFIQLGLRCNIKINGDFDLGRLEEDELDIDVPRETSGHSRLPPNGFVTTEQYDGLVEMHREELTLSEHNVTKLTYEVRDLLATLRKRTTALDKTTDRSLKLTAERDEFQAAYARANEQSEALRRANVTSSNTHIAALKGKNKEIKKLNGMLADAMLDSRALEDKVAGYELGMTKEQVKKECGKKPPAPKKVDSKNRPQLRDSEVWAIRRFRKKGKDVAWIAAHLNLNHQTVYKVTVGNTYSRIANEPKKETTAHAGHGVTTKEVKGND